MSNQGKTLKVRHYRRLDANSNSKEMVTEIVTLNSETGRFLEKMEEQRMTRPCFLTIDMRGKVQGACKRYLLDNRVFHLDSISYAIYQKGLTDNSNVYTLATYEAIVNGEHTHRMMNEEKKPSFIPVAPENDGPRGRIRESGPTHSDVGGGRRKPGVLYSPPIIPFGYHRRRGEERLQYVTAIKMSVGDMMHVASTRDISVSGILVGVKGFFDFEHGQVVTINFTVLQDEDEADGIDLSCLKYIVSHVERKQKECLLGLRIMDESRTDEFETYILSLIERYRRKYKLDVEDEFWSAAAWIYERVYTESMTPLPFFVAQDENGHLKTQTVVLSDGNKPLQKFFKKQGGLDDYSPLGLPHRLQYLQDHGEMLMVLYQAKVNKATRLYSASNNEFDNVADWYRFLQYALSKKGCLVVKMMVSSIPLKMPNSEKIEGIMEPMMTRCEDEAKSLLNRVGMLAFSAQLINITTQMKAVIAAQVGQSNIDDMVGVQAWTGNTRCHIVDDKVMETLSDTEIDLFPELIHFGTIKERREDRYLAEIGVNVQVDGESIVTVTRDISVHGMCVKLPNEVNLKADSDVTISLPKLQKMCPKASLSDIPYRLVKVISGQENLLRLERTQGNSSSDKIDDFFEDLIRRNKKKLKKDYQNIIETGSTRVYESVIVDNLAGVPFFIARDDQGKAIMQWVAVADKPSALANYFRSEDGRYDLRWITEAKVVVDLFGTIISMKGNSTTKNRRKMHEGIELYLYKTHDARDGNVAKMHSASELEFLEDEERRAFIDKAIASDDYLFVKLVATYSLEPNEAELSKMLNPLRVYSRHKVLKLQGQLRSLLGCGEMFDITKELLAERNIETAKDLER